MTAPLDLDVCTGGERGLGEGLVPISPYTALQYHFGMLLGVDDLETALAYPRGKMRLHNAWLHRDGVVWGFGVGIDAHDRKLAVEPGFALDAAGHELHLDTRACLDLGKWYTEHQKDPGFGFTVDAASRVTFTAQVVARFKACATRPVPAIADTCHGSETDTAYSRVFETVELLLRPRPAKEAPLPYERLRTLFGIPPDTGGPADVAAERANILALAPADRPAAFLDAFRRFAAFDEIDLHPQRASGTQRASIFPAEPADVLLADIPKILLEPQGERFVLADPVPAPDVTVRRSHVATATIQELLCGPPCGPAAGAGGGGGAQPPAAGADLGPQIIRKRVALSNDNKTITLVATSPLDPPSVMPAAFAVSSYDAGGWSLAKITGAAVDPAGTMITVDLEQKLAPVWRIIAFGTGPSPLLGVAPALIPLAGAQGDPPGTVHDGHDFVHMKRV
jgi:hypothetical protein